jgi:ElaB/YqjD/DUF883 family membrane-anchored ribosome-binding protein
MPDNSANLEEIFKEYREIRELVEKTNSAIESNRAEMVRATIATNAAIEQAQIAAKRISETETRVEDAAEAARRAGDQAQSARESLDKLHTQIWTTIKVGGVFCVVVGTLIAYIFSVDITRNLARLDSNSESISKLSFASEGFVRHEKALADAEAEVRSLSRQFTNFSQSQQDSVANIQATLAGVVVSEKLVQELLAESKVENQNLKKSITMSMGDISEQVVESQAKLTDSMAKIDGNYASLNAAVLEINSQMPKVFVLADQLALLDQYFRKKGIVLISRRIEVKELKWSEVAGGDASDVRLLDESQLQDYSIGQIESLSVSGLSLDSDDPEGIECVVRDSIREDGYYVTIVVEDKSSLEKTRSIVIDLIARSSIASLNENKK